MIDDFKNYHPLVSFSYFFIVIAYAMFILHPVYMCISLSAAFCYSILLNGKKALKFNVLYMLPMMIFMAIINPLFNHAGETILFYLDNGNPFTLESVVYGIVSATMIVNVILWFSCYNSIMSADKFMYLFGKVIPASSLIFSMALRFVPLYKHRLKLISNAQKCIGNDVSQGNLFQRAKNGMRILSIMTTWSLENSIETSDSMKARGYGLKNRTAFSNYRITKRDQLVLALLIILTLITFIAFRLKIVSISYFPWIRFTPLHKNNVFIFMSYFVLCYMPIFINLYDEMSWKMKSK